MAEGEKNNEYYGKDKEGKEEIEKLLLLMFGTCSIRK